MSFKDKMMEKLAKQSFNSPQFQHSWDSHMQVFAPVLEHAFEENYIAKIHLCAALNSLGTNQPSQCLFQLQQLEKHLKTDADKCAYYFFLGFYGDITKNQEQMIAMYTKANEFGHKLYLPYMKVAQHCMANRLYDQAERNYRDALKCFGNPETDPKKIHFLAICYTNLGTCLLNLDRLAEAEEALNRARQIEPDVSGLAEAEETLQNRRNSDQQ